MSFYYFLLLLLVHTAVPLAVGSGRGVPYFFFYVAALPLVLFNYPLIRKRQAFFLFLFTSLVVLNIMLSPGMANMPEKIKGALQLLLNVGISYLLFKSAVKNKEAFFTAVKAALIFVVIGSILEVVGLLKPLSDAFRQQFLTGALYLNDARDVSLAGHVRPKLFSLEPSFVSLLFLTLVNSALLLEPKGLLKKWVMPISLLMLWANPSPILLLSIFLSLAIVFIERRDIIFYFVIGSIVLLPLLLVLADQIDLITMLQRRLSRGASGTDNSTNRRLFIPFETAYETISRYPLFGIGITNDDFLKTFLTQYFTRTGDVVGNNLVAHMLIYFGVIGSLGLVFIFVHFSKIELFQSPAMVLLIFMVFAFSMGGLVIARFWFYFFVLLAALKVSELNREEAEMELEE